MAQLKDSTVNGNLTVDGDIVAKKGIYGVDALGEQIRMLRMGKGGDIIVEKDSTVNGNLTVNGDIYGTYGLEGEFSTILMRTNSNGDITIGDSASNSDARGNCTIAGNDLYYQIFSAVSDGLMGENFRPYYRAGDVLGFDTDNTIIRCVGYVTNDKKDVVFTIPLSKPIIGSVTAQVSGGLGGEGFILMQNGDYKYGSNETTYFLPPGGYDVLVNPHVGLIVTAHFNVSSSADVINNNPIGIIWKGRIALS